MITFLCIYLFVAGLNKAKDKPSVHDRQQIIEEKCKTGVKPFNHFCILNGRTKRENARQRALLYKVTQQFQIKALIYALGGEKLQN